MDYYGVSESAAPVKRSYNHLQYEKRGSVIRKLKLNLASQHEALAGGAPDIG